MIDRMGTANVVTAGKEEKIIFDSLPITPATIGLTSFTYVTAYSEQRDLITVRVSVGTDTLAAVVDIKVLAAALNGLDTEADPV